MTKLTVIKSPEDIQNLIVYLQDKEFVAFDCETTGLSRSAEIIGISVCADLDEAFYVILKEWDPILKTLTPGFLGQQDYTERLLNTLASRKLIMHNGVFDCSFVENQFGVKLISSLHTDTMILAHLLNENRRVALKELAKEYFGEDSTKEAREMQQSVLNNGGTWLAANKEMYKADSKILGKYGAQDAALTLKLFYELVPELFEQKLNTFFYDEESMPLLRSSTYPMNTVGLKVDMHALSALRRQLEAECLEAQSIIDYEIKNLIKNRYPGTNKKTTFNVSSNVQLSWLLFGEMKLEFQSLTTKGREIAKELNINVYSIKGKLEFTKTLLQKVGQIHQLEGMINGKKKSATKFKEPWAYIQVDKKTLIKFSSEYKWIAALLEYNRKKKLLNTYVSSLEERTQYGIIRPSFLQHGTTSGRYSSRNPNFQNLPRDDKRVKSCIVSRPGKVFVGADYSQLEPRIFAYFSQDTRLLNAFNGTDDFYSTIGMEVYGKTDCTPKKDGSPEAFGVKYKRLRDLSKVIALASTYGATARQLSNTTGKSVEDTQQDMNNYFDSFPGVRKMMLNSHKTAKDTGQVTNLFGRPRRIPEARKIIRRYGDQNHENLPYEIRSLLNLAVNHVIQSTGASICNRAMILFSQKILELGLTNCNIVMQVHDEIIVECQEQDALIVKKVLQDSMENVIDLKTIKLAAEPKIANNLADLK